MDEELGQHRDLLHDLAKLSEELLSPDLHQSAAGVHVLLLQFSVSEGDEPHEELQSRGDADH